MIQDIEELDIEEPTKAIRRQLAAVETSIAAAEKSLSELRDQRFRLAKSLEVLTGGKATSPAKDKLGRLSSHGIEILRALRQDANKIWKVEELQQLLDDRGAEVSDKYASNTLAKLYDRGLLIRVGRGKYRAGDQLLSIEGLMEVDHE